MASIRTGEVGSDEALAELTAQPAVRLLSPGPLSDDGVAAVLSSVFGHDPDAPFVRSCAEITAGNPFFVRELGVALKLDGIEPVAESTGQISGAAPPTIARAALAHLGRLPDDAAALARTIAVLGGDASLPRAAALADLGEDQALVALDALLAAEVVRTTNGLEFCHPIMHNAVYGELAPGSRSPRIVERPHCWRSKAPISMRLPVTCWPVSPSAIWTPWGRCGTPPARSLSAGAPDNAVAYLARAFEEDPDASSGPPRCSSWDWRNWC